MESTFAAENLEDLNNDTGQVNSKCLGVPVILRKIFQYFTSTELLQLSLVNKQWSYEARSLMRARGNIIASINKNETCQDLRAFASDFGRMREVTKVLPFSGMTITVGGSGCGNKDYCQQSPNRDLQPVYEEIIEGLTWKHFSIRHLDGWKQHESCPGFILGKKILRKLDSVLEELSIELECNAAKYFQAEFLKDCFFYRLKTFRFLNEDESLEPVWSDLIRTVVSNAPNLEVLYTEGAVKLEDNLLEGSSAVHEVWASYSPCRNEIPESVASKLKIHGIELMSLSFDLSFKTFNRITSMLLRSSHTVLSSMYVDIIYLAPLMNYGICLENVWIFGLALDPFYLEETQPPILRIAQSFDFTRTFPNLNTVMISILYHDSRDLPDEFNDMIERENATLRAPSPDRAVNIKHLKLWDVPPVVLQKRSFFSLLAQIFPSVEKLSIGNEEIVFADIRDIWVDLNEIDFTLSGDTVRNYDSVFCGIFPEEVAQLREEDEEYLRRVNIVPVMPTIAYLKGLRTFQVSYKNEWDSYQGRTDNPTCLFSKVTPLIAFQRCPNLTVTLTTEDERFAEALNHLKPFAPVVCKTSIRRSFNMDDIRILGMA